ncbi:MAG: alginate export family protein [Acidobacteria bacterium]|nr:alginate export family protein [Acidobacteriota bacterium]
MPSWVKFSAEGRVRFETLHGVQFNPKDNTYLLQRLRLNLTATPSSSLRLVLQAQDARVFFTNASPIPASQKDAIDLRIGYAEIGNYETRALTLRAGRQGLDFGEGRLLSDGDWSNVGRSFEAMRLTFRYSRLRLDAFSGVSDKISIDSLAAPTPGEHFHGMYASLSKIIPKAALEPYLFWKLEHKVKGEMGKLGNLDERTVGLRWVGDVPHGIDYGMESAVQRGTFASEPVSAWATHLIVRYSFRDPRHMPKIWAEVNRGSGDLDSKDGRHGAFDTLFGSSHDKFGVADQFCWTNLTHSRVGLQFRASNKLAISTAENWLWLTDSHDGIYSSGKVAIISNGLNGAFIGHEPDLQAKWKMRQRTQIDFSAGHVFAGRFLHAANHTGFNSVVMSVTQGF